MIAEVMESGIYKAFDGDRVLCTITSLGNNIYRAVNMNCDITVEVEDETRILKGCFVNEKWQTTNAENESCNGFNKNYKHNGRAGRGLFFGSEDL